MGPTCRVGIILQNKQTTIIKHMILLTEQPKFIIQHKPKIKLDYYCYIVFRITVNFGQTVSINLHKETLLILRLQFLSSKDYL